MINVALSESEYNNFKVIEQAFKDGFPQLRIPQRRRSAAGGGKAGGGLRRAKLAASASNKKTIIASIINETTGLPATSGDEFEATVYADIIGTNQRLDFAVPRLVTEDVVPVYQHIPSFTEWQAPVNYKIGDIVIWDDIYYSAVSDHLSVVSTPPLTADWEVFTFAPQWYIATLFMSSRTYTVENP